MMERILVVDDEPMVLSLLRECLEACGYDVLTALDGRRGLELARSHSPALILCDVRMPGVSGHEIAETLKTSPAHGHIPIIIMSGAVEEYRQKGHADHFLAKPFLLPELLTLIGNWLRDRRDAAAEIAQEAGSEAAYDC